jgi:hypothetical protein
MHPKFGLHSLARKYLNFGFKKQELREKKKHKHCKITSRFQLDNGLGTKGSAVEFNSTLGQSGLNSKYCPHKDNRTVSSTAALYSEGSRGSNAG